MKRLYTLLYMVALAMTVLAQNTTDAPNQRLRQLEESLQKQGYRVGFWQSNTYGHSIIRLWDIAMCVKGTPNTFKPMPDSIIAQRQERLEQALDAIRMAFADLSKEESTESQQYEYHKNGTDTVEYAMGFVNPRFKYKPTLNTGKRVFFANAYETADFYYRRNEDGWDNGHYSHRHKERPGVADSDMKPLDIAAFEAHLQPALKSAMALRGAYSCPIYWRHDAGFKDDYQGGLHMKYFSDSKDGSGLATGIRYFIPAQYKNEANRLFQQVDSLTYDYINLHRNQYYYMYNHRTDLPYPADDDEVNWYIRDTFNGTILQGIEYKNGKNYILTVLRRDDGLHILSFSSKGSAWMPKEWYKIKSYINGKLVYLKSAEKVEKSQAIADAIAAKRWHIDISTMNAMRYGSRTVTPDFYLELRGDTLHSNLPYLGQAQVSPTISPTIGLVFEAPVLNYKQSRPKSKYTQIDLDVKTKEDSYHYVIEIYDSGEATIRVRSQNRDPISFDGTLEIE